MGMFSTFILIGYSHLWRAQSQVPKRKKKETTEIDKLYIEVQKESTKVNYCEIIHFHFNFNSTTMNRIFTEIMYSKLTLGKGVLIVLHGHEKEHIEVRGVQWWEWILEDIWAELGLTMSRIHCMHTQTFQVINKNCSILKGEIITNKEDRLQDIEQ